MLAVKSSGAAVQSLVSAVFAEGLINSSTDQEIIACSGVYIVVVSANISAPVFALSPLCDQFPAVIESSLPVSPRATPRMDRILSD